MNAPLAGVRVLDVGTLTPGKYCGLLLADLGADVLRVERPQPAATVSDEDLALNQGKRSMTLNLRADAGRELFLTLAGGSDVVLESHRPGVADRLGIGYAAVRSRRPRVVYCSLSGYGASGPQSQAAGYDLIFAAQCGMLQALTGRSPRLPATYLADSVSGLTAAYAIVTALFARERSGTGTWIDLAMHDSLFALLAVSHGVRRPARRQAGGDGGTAAVAPTYAIYPAADGTWLALAAIRPASAAALFAHLGRPDLGMPEADPQQVARFLGSAFAAKPAGDWVRELAPLDVEAASVNDPLAAYDDEQLAARGMVARASHPEAGVFETIRPALRTGAGGGHAAGPAPRVGADTDAILAELGCDAGTVARLHATGVV